MNKRIIIFDLDGTILDTLQDLCNSVNYALKLHGLPARSLEQVRCDVGNGIRKLIRRSLPSGTSVDTYESVFKLFTQHYGAHCTDLTKTYPGIPELLTELHMHGFQTAVLSNKADFAVQLLIKQFYPDQFDAVMGERESIPKKPAPEGIFRILSSLGAEQCEAVYVGDSEVDIQTAANAKLPCICVDWGFRSRETLERAGAGLIVSSAEELLERLICF